MFDHVSNAYLAEPNDGLDTIGIRYIYRFWEYCYFFKFLYFESISNVIEI
jgi:hypothetical protein